MALFGDFNLAEEISNMGGALQVLADTTVNYATSGMIGVNDGRLGAGWAPRTLDEGLGELTGRNLFRRQMMDAQSAMVREQQVREQQIRDQRERARQMDVQASQTAMSVRESARARIQGYGPMGTQTGERDLLGL